LTLYLIIETRGAEELLVKRAILNSQMPSIFNIQSAYVRALLRICCLCGPPSLPGLGVIDGQVHVSDVRFCAKKKRGKTQMVNPMSRMSDTAQKVCAGTLSSSNVTALASLF